MDNGFTELVGGRLAAVLAARGIAAPRDVQRRVVPEMLAGRDVIAEAPTGSGKTLAYLLPLLLKIDMDIRGAQAVVLAPTRELAAQIAAVASDLGASAGEVGVALIIGGAGIPRQLERLKEKPRIIVGSAGRLLELIEMKKLSVHNVKTIVLDEADKLLDANNAAKTEALIHKTLKDRQLCAVSASMDVQAAARLMNDPVTIRAFERRAIPGNIAHSAVVVSRREKMIRARKFLSGLQTARALVFVNNPYHVENAAAKLSYHGVTCEPLYGDMPKEARRLAIERFRDGRARALVASDLAARGLDLPQVSHVVNLDVPEKPEDYLHRAGRAGREGGGAAVVTFAEPNETARLAAVEKAFGIVIERI